MPGFAFPGLRNDFMGDWIPYVAPGILPGRPTPVARSPPRSAGRVASALLESGRGEAAKRTGAGRPLLYGGRSRCSRRCTAPLMKRWA